MGLDSLIGDVLTAGGTARRRNKKAKRERREAREMIAQNTAMAQSMFDRDLGQTAFNNVRADPAMIAAQQQSLGRMQQVANEGYTDVDRQAMTQQLNDVARYEQSQRQSLAADARARGVSGSGMDIMSQLAAQQSGADRAMQTGTDMAIAGRERSYQANADAAQQAGAMRQQGFGEQAQVAGAQDQYGQWRIGQQSSDAATLMAARQGNADMLNQSAQRREDAFNEGINQAIQVGGAIANAYTGGAAGAAGGVANSVGGGKTVGSSGLPSSGTGAYQTGGGGGAKGMGRGPSVAPAPGATTPASGAPAQKSMTPAGAPAAKSMTSASPTRLANTLNRVQGALSAGGPQAQSGNPANAVASAYSGAARPAGQRVARLPNARRRGGLLLGGR